MRTSKYLNKKFGNWTVTYVGVARVQPAFLKGTRQRAARAGHQTYYYIFERKTSDGKADKMIRLSAGQAVKVYRGLAQVEDYAIAKAKRNSTSFTGKVSYHFFKQK